MSTGQPIYLKDYKPHPFKIDQVDLEFDLDETKTIVTSTMKFSKNSEEKTNQVVLNGENITLLKVEYNGIETKDFTVTDTHLTVNVDSDQFVLKTTCEINPKENTALEGLYLSDGAFCTQNEPEGFRKITYFLDRPDNMSIFMTTLRADKTKYPFALSNGNKIDEKDLGDGRHQVTWKDPFPKPAYLYALVAGDLALVKDTYTTKSGREVALEIYVDKGNEDKCSHAMESLKNSMKWDEDVYGLEYDLDIYMIVAVDAFNMGAMENKGLNIFNSQYVLAKPQTATDGDFEGVEGVIGHEYFHNWTGNRVTCRDWFQLTLKEGLTVFRDQEFSADMTNRAVKRIEDVERLKAHQFKEDASPLSHPIKPKQYIEMNNFYTATVYEKGAEVIRMIHTLIGAENFRKGMDRYFELYDGQAVTTQDFVHAMEEASGFDFTQFKRWYSQAGTPQVDLSSEYDEASGKITLKLKQSLPERKENTEEVFPLLIPLKLAFFSESGQQLEVTFENGQKQNEFLLQFNQAKQSFTFTGFSAKPVLSVNRGFSAPIELNFEQTAQDYITLMSSDTDSFNRYDAVAKMMEREIFAFKKQIEQGATPALSSDFKTAFSNTLTQATTDPKFFAFALGLPEESVLNGKLKICAFDEIHEARKTLKHAIAFEFNDLLLKTLNSIESAKEYSIAPKEIGNRMLRNLLLSYLSTNKTQSHEALVYEHYDNASNMTDEISSLRMIVNFEDSSQKDNAINGFIDKWKGESLVVNKWLSAVASTSSRAALEKVKAVESHPLFDKKNPNKVRSLYGSFMRNLVNFHALDGSGYQFMADKIIELDEINPQIASRLSTGFGQVKKVDAKRSSLMREQMNRILAKDKLSKDTFEIISKYQ